MPANDRAAMLSGSLHGAALAALRCLALILLMIAGATFDAAAAGRLEQFLTKAQPGEFFTGADRFGDIAGDPPIAPSIAATNLPAMSI